MNKLLEIQAQLQDTNATLARLEPAIAEHPEVLSLHATVESLRSKQASLERAFLNAASELGQDVCSYRLITDGSRPTLAALSTALKDFQNLFSIVYEAIKNGPKQRATFGEHTAEVTSLCFAYTFPGSLGVALTIPNERMRSSDKTDLDRTVEVIFQIAKAEEPRAIAALAKELGKPPIFATYHWAKDHATFGLGVDIEWRREKDVRDHLQVQQPELQRLHEIIALSSEEKVEIMTTRGQLEMADIRRHTFRISTEDGESIRGRFDDAISQAHTVILPRKYVARLRKTSKVVYSTEEEEVSYFLEKLDNVLL